MAKKFNVSFEMWTDDEMFTEADAQAEIERFTWSTNVNVKNIKVNKQRPYWIKAKCPKCKSWNKIKDLKDNIVETSWVLGNVVVKLELKCEKCGHAFSWAEQINPLRLS